MTNRSIQDYEDSLKVYRDIIHLYGLTVINQL